MNSEVEFLKNLSFFEGFSLTELEQLLELNRIDRYNMGETIVKENEEDESNAGHYYVILRGAVDVLKQNRKLTTLEQGDCFGELAYLTKEKRTADVIAVSDQTLLLEIDGWKIDRIKTSDIRNKLIRKIAITLAKKLTNASEMLANNFGFTDDIQEVLNENKLKELNLFQFLSRARLLKSIPFFAPFSTDQIAEILSLPHSFVSPKDNQIIGSSKKPIGKFHIFYIILKGLVKVVKQGKIVSTLNQGDCFTQVEKLDDGKEQKTDLVAEKGSKIFAFNFGIFENASKETQLLFYKQFGKHQARRLAN
tara:strand:+ start:13354 stop:14274 length:921 start_codon:yes stop_codon:yes gene_type:complete